MTEERPAAGGRAAPASSRVDLFERALRRLTPRVFVTYLLVAINVAAFGLMAGTGVSPMDPAPDELIAWGASFGPLVSEGQWWRLVSANYLHYGALHIGLNMYVLFRVGPLVERLLGNASFGVMYVLSGIAGSVASVSYHPVVVSAGASGAVFGVFGALLAIVLRQRDSIPPERLGPLRSYALTFIVANVALGFSVSFVDNAAHLGGLAGGFLAGAALSRPIVGEPRRNPLARVALVAAGGAALLAALGLALVPRDLVDPHAEVDAFTSEVNALLGEIDEGYARVERGETSYEHYLQTFEDDWLPRWKAARQRLDAVEGLPDEAMEAVGTLKAYADKREEGMRLWLEGAKTGDEALVERGLKLQREAEGALAAHSVLEE